MTSRSPAPILAVALLFMALSGSAMAARPSLTTTQITADIHRRGAKPVVDQLYQSGQWDEVLHHIAGGAPGWIALAPQLEPGTDADTAESLGIALASALPASPAAVLRVLDLKDGPTLGVQRVCGVPFIEPPPSEVTAYKQRVRKALAPLQDSSLSKAKTRCLASLRRS